MNPALLLGYLKAIAALVGASATAALGILPPAEYRWLAVLAAICTAVATYAVPNFNVVIEQQPDGRHEA
jgi:hypothetical protein